MLNQKISDKSKTARPLSADFRAAHSTGSKTTVRPLSADRITKLTTPEGAPNTKPGILKSISANSQNVSAPLKAEPEASNSSKSELTVGTPTENSYEAAISKKISFSEPKDATTAASKTETEYKVVAKDSDDESEASAETCSESDNSVNTPDSPLPQSKEDDQVFKLSPCGVGGPLPTPHLGPSGFEIVLLDTKLGSHTYISTPSKMSAKPCGTHYEPKPFSANDNDLKAREWLDFFERYATFKEMSHDRRCAYFGLLMRGPAEVWWNTLTGSVKHEYDELRKRFLGSFANEDFHKLRAATEMHTRKQGANETVTDYYTAMINLTKELPAVTEDHMGPAELKLAYNTIARI